MFFSKKMANDFEFEKRRNGHQRKMGIVKLYIGSMGSGKTRRLGALATRCQMRGMDVVFARPEIDTRSRTNDMICKGLKDIKCHKACDLYSFIIETYFFKNSNRDNLNSVAILIDEGQFFDDLAIKADSLASLGATVGIATLSSDFQRKPWPNTAALVAIADRIKHCTRNKCARCESHNGAVVPAPFSAKISGDRNARIEIDTGAPDAAKYEPLCRSCFYAHSSK